MALPGFLQHGFQKRESENPHSQSLRRLKMARRPAPQRNVITSAFSYLQETSTFELNECCSGVSYIGPLTDRGLCIAS